MAKVILPQSALDTVPELQQLAMQALMKGARNEAVGDSVIYSVSNDKLSLNVAKFIISKGGEVSDLPLWIKVTKTDNVPNGIAGATYKDEEGATINRTWEEWKKLNHTFFEGSNGNTYIGTNAHTGSNLPLSGLIPVFDNLITLEEVKALQPSEEI